MPCAIAGSLIELPKKTAPEWVQVFPLGDFSARDGRSWRIADQAAARAVIQATRDYFGKTDPFIDYDHQYVASLANAQGKPGGTAPAAAWIKGLEVRDGAGDRAGIWARVEWTAKARSAIEAGEYRYLSPFFSHTPSGDVTRLYNVALVNVPAMEQLQAVAAAIPPFSPGDTPAMDPTPPPDQAAALMSALAKALGLPDTAGADEVLSACSDMSGLTNALSGALATALGLPNTSPAKDVLAAANAQKTTTAKADEMLDPAAHVPRALYDALRQKVENIETSMKQSAATAAVDSAIQEGRLPPAQRDWGLKYAAQDLAGFRDFARSASPLFAAASPRMQAPPSTGRGQGQGQGSTLSPEEQVIADRLGVTPEGWAAAAAKIDGHGRTSTDKARGNVTRGNVTHGGVK